MTTFNWSWVAAPADTNNASGNVPQGGGTIFSFRQPAGGAVSSSNLSAFSSSVSQNLQANRSDWRTYIRPILNSLPAGNADQRWAAASGAGLAAKIDCFTYGVQGSTLFVFNDADATKADGRYWHATEYRPKTMAEAFEDIHSDIADITDTAAVEDFVDLDPLWAAIGEDYRDPAVVAAVGSLDTRVGTLNTYITQLNDDIYEPTTYPAYQIGAPLTYSIAAMLDNLLQLHNVAGGWGANPTGVSHAGLPVATHTHTFAQVLPPPATASTQARVGPYTSLNNEILRLRYEIQATRGSTNWYSDVTSPFVGTPVVNLRLHANYVGSGTASANNPHAIDYTDTGADTIFTAIRGFTGMSNNTDNSPTYSSNNFITDGDSLETAIGKIDAGTFGSASTDLDSAYDWGGAGLGRSITLDSGALDLYVPDSVYTSNPAIEIEQDSATDDAAIVLAGTSDRAGMIQSIDLPYGGGNDLGTGIMSEAVSGFTGDILLSVIAGHDGTAGDAYMSLINSSIPGSAYLGIMSVAMEPTELAQVHIDAFYATGTDNATINIGCGTSFGAANNRANVNVCTAGQDHDIVIGSITNGVVTDLDILSYSDILTRSAGGVVGIQGNVGVALYSESAGGASDEGISIAFQTDDGVGIYDTSVNLIWAMGTEALNLDFTGLTFDTISELDAIGVKLNAVSPSAPAEVFTSELVNNVGGYWTHSAGNGWTATATTPAAPAMLIPLCRTANWEAEITFSFPDLGGTDSSSIFFGACDPSGRWSWYGESHADANEADLYYRARLLTNDGDDTETERYAGVDIVNADGQTFTLKIRSLNGTIGVWDDEDDAWHNYIERWGAASTIHCNSYVFIQIDEEGEQDFVSPYLESFVLRYLS